MGQRLSKCFLGIISFNPHANSEMSPVGLGNLPQII